MLFLGLGDRWRVVVRAKGEWSGARSLRRPRSESRAANKQRLSNLPSLLIGGLGADLVNGGGDDDLLIAGWTLFDQNIAALEAISREWSSSRDYQTRILNLTDGSGSPERLNGLFFLVLGETVFDDEEVDRLIGASDIDWFFLDLEDDIAPGVMPSEVLNNEL
ncbi:MAG: hypothetical protein KDB14_34510 [Planctomycetales bacterium]|nr:hypothetical protein [Planctomycetales bacterium]